ncbi:unnamed protein product [Urochloa humidicola]
MGWRGVMVVDFWEEAPPPPSSRAHELPARRSGGGEVGEGVAEGLFGGDGGGPPGHPRRGRPERTRFGF